MSEVVYDTWPNEGTRILNTLYERDRPTHSQLLGPNGEPLKYRVERVGFDLTPHHGDKTNKQENEHES